MKQSISKSIVGKSLALMAVIAALFSFSSPGGGDLYEIYIDHKMVLQQFVTAKEPLKILQLQYTSPNQQLDIFYSHCGKAGTKRKITIKAGHTTLKQWSYPDAASINTRMSCKIKELMSLQQLSNSMPVDLIYSSNEMPEGKILAALVLENNNEASVKR